MIDTEEYGLDEDQIKFITNKVKELKTQYAVKKFYNTRDTVAKFAKDLAEDLFGDEDEMEDEVEEQKETKKTTKKKKTVKKKRKIEKADD